MLQEFPRSATKLCCNHTRHWQHSVIAFSLSRNIMHTMSRPELTRALRLSASQTLHYSCLLAFSGCYILDVLTMCQVSSSPSPCPDFSLPNSRNLLLSPALHKAFPRTTALNNGLTCQDMHWSVLSSLFLNPHAIIYDPFPPSFRSPTIKIG